MPKKGVHFTVFIAKSESCEFYEVRGGQSISGFLAIFVVGSLEAAMKFAMKFYRVSVRGIVVSKRGYYIVLDYRQKSDPRVETDTVEGYTIRSYLILILQEVPLTAAQ